MGFQAGLDSLKRNRCSLYGRNCNFIPHVFKVFQKEIYIVIYKALKILSQYQPKKTEKQEGFECSCQ